jgi:hypothetical protein
MIGKHHCWRTALTCACDHASTMYIFSLWNCCVGAPGSRDYHSAQVRLPLCEKSAAHGRILNILSTNEALPCNTLLVLAPSSTEVTE